MCVPRVTYPLYVTHVTFYDLYMPKVFTSKTQKIGELGEGIACKYLSKRGYIIIERNFTLPVGEIDIIATKDGITHFIEVKAINVPRATDKIREITQNTIRPEENMHPKKLERLYRTIMSYMSYKKDVVKDKWQLDLLCIYLCPEEKWAKVKTVENIVVN